MRRSYTFYLLSRIALWMENIKLHYVLHISVVEQLKTMKILKIYKKMSATLAFMMKMCFDKQLCRHQRHRQGPLYMYSVVLRWILSLRPPPPSPPPLLYTF
jgi:hypothetical protein